MVPAANIVMIAILLFILLQTIDTFQNLTAVQRMLFHNCKFFCRKPAGFIQDIVRDRYFADVMQCRRHRNILDGLIAHFIFGILPSQLLQHDLGQLADTLDMLSGFAVAEFNDRTQSIDHSYVEITQLFILLFDFSHLFLDQLFQFITITVQFDDIINALADIIWVERF